MRPKLSKGAVFYTYTFKPLALQNVRAAAETGRFDAEVTLDEERDIHYWLNAVDEMRKKDADFEGFKFTYMGVPGQRIVYLQWE
jgi:hypothetical protein